MNVQKRNEALIYCLSSGPTIPEWLGERARRNLSKRDESIRRRIELIQDFQMPSSSTKLVQSSDGRYIMAAGTYPPRVRCYDVHELSMKFERYLNAHVTDMVMLGDDYGKMALLLDDRTIAFHAPYGAHESIRIPSFGRAMAYEPTTCEILVAAKGNQLYRVNLEEGRFSEPWSIEKSTASSSCIAVGPTHPIAVVGCDDGVVRFWDNRSPDSLLKPFLSLDVSSGTKGYGYADDPFTNSAEIRSIAQDPSGLHLAAGTAGGIVALYDVRSSRPLHVMEHKHGMPIHTVKFHPYSGCILSGDEKLVKVWRYKASTDIVSDDQNLSMGSVIVNVEGTGKLSHFILAGDEADPTGNRSGLLLCATDEPKMESFYIPSVGLAPKWCSFLENITEELEERDVTKGSGTGTDSFVQDGQETVFENYKFVSRDEVESLGISNLVGTPLLRGYMHGFFMDIQLYNRVRAVANPFEYEEYRKKKLKERMEAKRASRIAPKETARAKTSVNPQLADRLFEKSDNTKAGKVAKQVLTDNRFGNLFTNPDFEIDEDDHAFKLRNPSGVAANKKRKNDLDSDDEEDDADIEAEENGSTSSEKPIGFTRVESDEGDSEESDRDSGDDSDEDGFAGAKVRGEMYEQMRKPKTKVQTANSTKKHKTKSKAVMYEADDLGSSVKDAVGIGLGDSSAHARVRRRNEELNMTLEERLAAHELARKVVGESTTIITKGQGVSREVSFVPKASRGRADGATKGADTSSKRKDHERRGIKELGFKTPINKGRKS